MKLGRRRLCTSPGKAGCAAFCAAAAGWLFASQVHAQAPATSEPAPLASSSGPAIPTQADATSAPPPPAPTWIAQPGWTGAHRAAEQDVDLPPLPAPPQRAHRQRVFLNPGYLFSMTPAVASREYASAGRTTYTDVATGHGVELSVSIWQPRSFVCFGTFAQWQRYLSFNGDHNRYAFGLQAAWAIFGLEAGMARREGDELRQGTTMLHFGPVMSLAFFHIAGRFGIPISGDNGGRPHHKSEASMVLAVKIPLPLL